MTPLPVIEAILDPEFIENPLNGGRGSSSRQTLAGGIRDSIARIYKNPIKPNKRGPVPELGDIALAGTRGGLREPDVNRSPNKRDRIRELEDNALACNSGDSRSPLYRGSNKGGRCPDSRQTHLPVLGLASRTRR